MANASVKKVGQVQTVVVQKIPSTVKRMVSSARIGESVSATGAFVTGTTLKTRCGHMQETDAKNSALNVRIWSL